MRYRTETLLKILIWTVSVLMSLWLGMYALSQTLPYEPYRVQSYESIPDELCPGGAVEVSVTRYADPDGRIQSITTRTSWENVDTGASTGITEFVTVWDDEGVSDRGDYGLHTVESNIQRAIPEEPGEYRIVSEYDVRGKVLLFDRVDTFSLESAPLLKVLPEDAKQCVEQRGGS